MRGAFDFLLLKGQNFKQNSLHMNSTRMVSIASAIESSPALRKFRRDRFVLTFEGGIPLSERASDAGIDGDTAILCQGPSRRPLAVLGAYAAETLKTTESVKDFINSPAVRNRYRRAANLDECVAFIALYPDEARSLKLVCLNSGLFLVDDYPTLIEFSHCGNRFNVIALRETPQVIPQRSTIIFKL